MIVCMGKKNADMHPMGNLFPEHVSIIGGWFKFVIGMLSFLICMSAVYFLGPDGWYKQITLQVLIIFLLLIIMRLLSDQWAWSWIKEWRQKNPTPYQVAFYLDGGKLETLVSKSIKRLTSNLIVDEMLILPLNMQDGELIIHEDDGFMRYRVKNVSRRDKIPLIVIIQEPQEFSPARKEFRITLPADIALQNAQYMNHGLDEFLNQIVEKGREREKLLLISIQKSVEIISNCTRKTRPMHEIREQLEARLNDQGLLLIDSPWCVKNRF